jgi:hypothetical protein
MRDFEHLTSGVNLRGAGRRPTRVALATDEQILGDRQVRESCNS